MKTYIVTMRNKSLFSKNTYRIKADNFTTNPFNSNIIFVDADNKRVAMFKDYEVKSIEIGNIPTAWKNGMEED